MTPSQALEIHRLASLWATARVLVARKRRGELPLITENALKVRARKAEAALLQALHEQVSGPDNADATQAWQALMGQVT